MFKNIFFLILIGCSHQFIEKDPLLVPPIAKDEIPVKQVEIKENARNK